MVLRRFWIWRVELINTFKHKQFTVQLINYDILISALLELVHETENDDLTTVVQKFVCLYCEQVIPYAVEITQNLVSNIAISLVMMKISEFYGSV